MVDRITDDFKAKIFNQLKMHEGLSLTPYKDTKNNWTIGIGHLLVSGQIIPERIDLDEAISLFWSDFNNVIQDLDRKLYWWRFLPEIQRRILVDITFNMGIGRLLGFRHMLNALYDGDNILAAKEMKDSDWYRDLDKLGSPRAETLISWMKKGHDEANILDA